MLLLQIGNHWRVDDRDVLFPSPIAHIGGSIYAFGCPLPLAVLMERWDPHCAVALMTSERCTHMAGATPFLVDVLTAAEQAETRLPDLKVFICGGASVPPSLIRRAAASFKRAAVSSSTMRSGPAISRCSSATSIPRMRPKRLRR
ncbi:MAG TPA: AMP-binding protein [Mycobacterium sp.]|nr:AMP-binding protein [Mycobacterium sp.]